MSEENSYYLALQLKGKLLQEISYAKAVIETVGEPCDGYLKRLIEAQEFLKHVDEYLKVEE
jgi:hypothetical protein